MENHENHTKTHILAIPFPAQGHLNPMVQLCKRLVSAGVRVTLITTASISKTLNIQPDPKNPITIETVPDCTIDDDDKSQTLNFYERVVETFKLSMFAGLPDIIQKHSNSNLKVALYDSTISWALDIIHGQGLKGAVLFTQPLAVCSVYYHLHKGILEIRDVCDVEFDILLPGLPVLKLKDLPSLVYDKKYASLLKLVLDQFSTFENADWRLFNTFDKLEDKILEWSARQFSFYTIGPTIPSMYIDKRIQGNYSYGLNFFEPTSKSCIEWLDTKEDNSVIYLSFGSMTDFGEKQIVELAQGMINSGYCFLWIIKDPKVSKLSEEVMSVISEKGIIVKWCNQLEVLSHRAVGCFITHCGWNSATEALSLGVPMVAMPHWTDQTTNAKLIVDVWKIGVRVKIDENGIADREEITACVKSVMDEDRGGEIRRNSLKWKNLAVEAVSEGGSSDKNIVDFVKALNGQFARELLILEI